MKGRSHFCLIPAGTSPWTNQLYVPGHNAVQGHGPIDTVGVTIVDG